MTTFFTVTEAAKQCRLSKSAMYGLLRRGELSYYRLGGRRLISPEQLEQYFAAHTFGAQPPRTGEARDGR